MTRQILRLIQETIDAIKIDITPEEAIILAPKLKLFISHMGRAPEINAADPQERRLAEFIIYMKNYAREKAKNG